MNSHISHQIGTKAGTQIVKDGVAADLNWTDIAISCETALSIVVVALAELSETPHAQQFASEIIDTMTQAVHGRVTAYLLGKSYEG